MKSIYKRPLKNVLLAPFRRRNIRSVVNIFSVYDRPFKALMRYLSHSGTYPLDVTIRNKELSFPMRIDQPDDELTLIEVFCSMDYPLDSDDTVVVDIGSNIGLSALYFLTSSKRIFTYLYEPDPKNLTRLTKNISAFSGRFELNDSAVADYSGEANFSIEPSGRYGTLNNSSENKITVKVLDINAVIEKVLQSHPTIDVLKIDTEGQERSILKRIDRSLLPRIKKIYLDEVFEPHESPEGFALRQYGCVCQLYNKRFRSASQP